MSEKARVLLNKDQLVTQISEVSGETKAAVVRVMDAIPQVTINAVLKDPPKLGEVVSVPLPGIGTFGAKFVAKSERINNMSKQKYTVPAHIVPTFKVTRSIKVELNPTMVKTAAKAATKPDAKAGTPPDAKSAKKTA